MATNLLGFFVTRLRRRRVARQPSRWNPGRSSEKRRTASSVGLMAVLLVSLLIPGVAAAGKPDIDPSWADGKIVYMIGPHLITNPNPNLYAQSEELYLLVFPINPTGSTTLGPQTLPSGYQPNCNPCFHPGIPLQFAYHDHVLTGAPGSGKNGTADVFKAPWKIILLIYNPEFALSPTFTPVTSASDVDAAETAGKFLPINPGGANPFEIETGNVLICPLVAPDA
jgi:hypothetical protein